MMEKEKNLKPCLVCDKPCEIYSIQLGDVFTTSYLRICSDGCLFDLAHEFLYSICEHKNFRNWLSKKELKEDSKERDAFIDEITNYAIESIKESLKGSENLLSRPKSPLTEKMFGQGEIPQKTGPTMRFKRPSLKDRIKWQKEFITRQKTLLKDAEDDLREMENERLYDGRK